MRALVIDSVETDETDLAIKRPVLRHIPFRERNGECRIRVTYAGICGTDLELIRGYADYTGIPGHEFVGVAEGGPKFLVMVNIIPLIIVPRHILICSSQSWVPKYICA